jgi:hypothetical protein
VRPKERGTNVVEGNKTGKIQPRGHSIRILARGKEADAHAWTFLRTHFPSFDKRKKEV